MAGRELAGYALFSPDFLARPFWVLGELFISFSEIFVDGGLRDFQGRKIAIVNDCSSHATEYRFDDVQELRAGWQRNELHSRMPFAVHTIDLVNARVQRF